MTLFLWHMTAYLIVILALWPLGVGLQQDTTVAWWLERPIWILVPGAVLGVIVLLVGRFERHPARSIVGRRASETGPSEPAKGAS